MKITQPRTWIQLTWFVLELTFLGGVGAVVLYLSYTEAFVPTGPIDWAEVLSFFPVVPIIAVVVIFLMGALAELLCALVAAAVVAGLLALPRGISSHWITLSGGVVAACVAAILAPLAALASQMPNHLVVGSFVFFNIVTCALLIRLRFQRATSLS